jgi:hypothetical protein
MVHVCVKTVSFHPSVDLLRRYVESPHPKLEFTFMDFQEPSSLPMPYYGSHLVGLDVLV